MQQARNIESVPSVDRYGWRDGRETINADRSPCVSLLFFSSLMFVCVLHYLLSVGPDIQSYLLPGAELECSWIMRYAPAG